MAKGVKLAKKATKRVTKTATRAGKTVYRGASDIVQTMTSKNVLSAIFTLLVIAAIVWGVHYVWTSGMISLPSLPSLDGADAQPSAEDAE